VSETSPCPICGDPVQAWERYPNLLCTRCAGLAVDAERRRLRFGSDSPLGGGFVAEVEDEGTWRVLEGVASVECRVNGRRCVAHEHRFGGVAVQALDT
jgi:hypothetical protein